MDLNLDNTMCANSTPKNIRTQTIKSPKICKKSRIPIDKHRKEKLKPKKLVY
jgi:hypothetical protein